MVVVRFAVFCLIAGSLTLAPGRAAPDTAAPTEYVNRRWITDDGLPHNVVLQIAQDKTGFLWLATMAGLSRFDGREFKVFPVPQRPVGGGLNIRSLAVLEDGSVLFLPASGGLFQLKDDTVVAHPLSPELQHDDLREVYAEPGSGVIWIGTGDEILRCAEGHIQRFGAAEGIMRRGQHWAWATDGDGRTWIGATDFLGYYEGGKLVPVKDLPSSNFRVAAARSGGVWIFGDALYKWDHHEFVRVADPPWPSGRASVRCMYEDHTGVLWLGTSREGVFRLENSHFYRLPNIEPAVEFVTEDQEGDLWLATDGGGIQRLRTKLFAWSDALATGIGEGADGALWLAAGADGLVRRENNVERGFQLSASRAPLHVAVVSVDHRGDLWLGARTGVYVAPADKPTDLRRVEPLIVNPRLLFCGSSGEMWISADSVLGYFRDGVFKSLASQLPGPTDMTALAEYPAGHLWFGTSRGLVYECVDDVLTRSSIELGTGTGAIHTILPEANGIQWIATTEGLVLVNGGHVRRFTQADGLPDDIVLQLLEDDRAHLWITTPHGLFRLERAELLRLAEGGTGRLNVVGYGPEQGVVGISPITNYQPSMWKDHRGRLWFCTYKGVLGVDPARMESKADPPRVLIDEVRLDDQRINARNGLRVPPGEKQIEFRFSALSFAAPEQVKLRHQLEGFDRGWVATPPDRSARYAKLPPGNYRLRVIACSSEGVWGNEEAILRVRVLPAWWQTPWSRLAMLLFFAGVVGGSVRFWSNRKLKLQLERLERAHALEKERARIARDLHDDLGSSLTGINLAVQRLHEHHTPELAKDIEVLDRRVRRFTLELDRVVWSVGPQNASLDRLAEFIEQFVHNLFSGSGIECHVFGSAAIPAIPLTPDLQHHVLAVTKEALSNVLKHSRATAATLTQAFQAGEFTLTIRDNGVGFEPEAQGHSRRNGLKNIRTRGAEIGGIVEIRSTPGSGTELVLRVHLPTTSKR